MVQIREAFRQPLSVRRPGIVLSIAALSSLIACSCGKSGKATAEGSSGQDKALSVKIVPVESREVRRTVESVGSLWPRQNRN